MDRRSFLKAGFSAGAFGAFHLASGQFSPTFAGLPAPALGRKTESEESKRILVVLRLDGGNDGLNTVLPLDQYDNLANARGNILIPASKALRLTNTVGLHPAMTGLHEAFMNGNLRIVQAVGYPNHNQSHFRSTDIWFTGSDSNQVLESGVLGRYLDGQFPNFPVGYPSAAKPHPPSIQIGSTLFTLLQGSDAGLGMAINDPSSVYALQSNGLDAAPDTPAGHELTFLRQMASQTRQYGDALKATMSAAATRSALYPATGNRLADQLKAVARLIAGGLQTRVYVVSLGGFDTHSAQVVESDTTTGKHADLLRQMSVAITAFMDDLRLMGVEDRVVGITVSEFGRRILSNASFGTDHGLAAPMMLFGAPVAGGITGVNPTIPAKVTSSNNVGMQYDFRSVYASLLRDWLMVDKAECQRVLLKDFPGMDLIDANFSGRPPGTVRFKFQVRQYDRQTTFSYNLEESAPVNLTIFDLHGKTVRNVPGGTKSAGFHEAILDTRSLIAGRYFARLQVASGSQQLGFDVFE